MKRPKFWYRVLGTVLLSIGNKNHLLFFIQTERTLLIQGEAVLRKDSPDHIHSQGIGVF